jgi:hypothetical protein
MAKPKAKQTKRAGKKAAPAGAKRPTKPAKPVKKATGRRAPSPRAKARPAAPPPPARAREAQEPREAPSGSRGKYVYCIIRSKEALRFGRIGLGAEPAEVTTVNYKDLAAVVSDAPTGVLDPTRENVLAHNRVNETIVREHTVLPMSFGTVFKTRDDIVELLRSAYEAFGDVLHKMQDKFEFGLKVLWDRDQVIKQIEAGDENLQRLKSEIASQKGSTYFARMQYGRSVDSALQVESERYVASIFEALRDVSVASRTNKPIGDKMILNAAFLVSREKEGAFDAKVKAIGARYEKLTFRYTGPWPPYNFVNIRLKLERAAGDSKTLSPQVTSPSSSRDRGVA